MSPCLKKVLSDGFTGGGITPVGDFHHSGGSGGGSGLDSVKTKRRGLFSQLMSATASAVAAGGPSSRSFQRSAASNKLYICCVLYHQDKVLMTNEDALPLVLVDDLTGMDQVSATQGFNQEDSISFRLSSKIELRK